MGSAVLIALAALDVLSLHAVLLAAAGVGVVSLFLWGCLGRGAHGRRRGGGGGGGAGVGDAD
ncbi:hypothetical protein [Streptomyces sp. NPDC013187]|uniref:hypothetical protein n=1 Tax=Streptomyces sp. NPDC013187 TaxID=3364865 RepID=UPI00367F7A0C